MAGVVHVTIEDHVAVLTNDNPDKHNAFDDEMDVQLFDAFGRIAADPEVRAVIWRAEGKSFSSGRDVGSIGTNKTELSHHELMRRGHRGIQQLWELDAPVIVACKGWSMGGSFQRALLCDLRIAAEGARFRLPEVTHGVIPDTGGVAVLYEMVGHGLVSDMVLTGRVLSADEALTHGIVSRVVPEDELDATAQDAVPRFLKTYRDRHQATILLTSHYMQDVTAMASRALMINRGRLLFDGHLDSLVQRMVTTKRLELVLGDDQRRAEMVARGRERVQLFSWERSVRSIHAGYMRALGVPVPALAAEETT